MVNAPRAQSSVTIPENNITQSSPTDGANVKPTPYPIGLLVPEGSTTPMPSHGTTATVEDSAGEALPPYLLMSHLASPAKIKHEE